MFYFNCRPLNQVYSYEILSKAYDWIDKADDRFETLAEIYMLDTLLYLFNKDNPCDHKNNMRNRKAQYMLWQTKPRPTLWFSMPFVTEWDCITPRAMRIIAHAQKLKHASSADLQYYSRGMITEVLPANPIIDDWFDGMPFMKYTDDDVFTSHSSPSSPQSEVD